MKLGRQIKQTEELGALFYAEHLLEEKEGIENLFEVFDKTSGIQKNIDFDLDPQIIKAAHKYFELCRETKNNIHKSI